MMVQEDTCLDFVHVADSVIELDGSPFLHIGLLLGRGPIQGLRCCRRRCVGIPSHRRVSRDCATWASWLTALLDGAVIVEGSALTGPLRDHTVAGLGGCAELGFGAFYAVLYRSLPVRWSLLFYKSLCGSR